MLSDLSKQIAKPLQCPDCDIDMQFLALRATTPVFVSTLLERTFFLCPNCARLSQQLVVRSVLSSANLNFPL
jgi:hypothetical protein